METNELVKALNRLKVETGSLVLCAHFCNDGKPVYRPDEGCLAYCEKCGMDCRCFEWRGILGTIPEEEKAWRNT